jgi:hypothetical protein
MTVIYKTGGKYFKSQKKLAEYLNVPTSTILSRLSLGGGVKNIINNLDGKLPNPTKYKGKKELDVTLIVS